jgi:hypothetical protein
MRTTPSSIHQRPGGNWIHQQGCALFQFHILAQWHAELRTCYHVFRLHAACDLGIRGGAGYTPVIEEARQHSRSGLDYGAAAFKSGYGRERLLQSIEPLNEHQVGWIDG